MIHDCFECSPESNHDKHFHDLIGDFDEDQQITFK